MTPLAALIWTVLLTTAPCADDRLEWDAVADPTLLRYEVTLGGAVVAWVSPSPEPSFTLGCLEGLACVTAVNSGGSSAATCTDWGHGPGKFLTIERSCALRCKPAGSGACCLARDVNDGLPAQP